MDPLSQFFTRLWSGFSSLDAGKKISLFIAVVISLSSILALVYFTNQIDYRILFSGLGSEDAGSIVGKLQEKKIPYRISPDGATVSVPSEKVSELRLEMATAGLPHGGGVGFEIFDNKTIGATEFEQRLNYLRAQQGELSRTINSLDEIQQSRVHLAIPKDSLFVDQQKKATASVTIKLKTGRSLRQTQIDGIAHLVASSIEGMNAEDVMIIDSVGNILSKNTGDSKLTKMSGAQSDYQQGIEKDLASRIQSMLENVVGTGKAVVRVSADLDFRMTEKTEETYDPESPVVRSTQKQSEKSSAPVTGKSAAAASAENEKTDETINYEINKVISKTVMPVGEIKKLSIAVLVDGTYTKNKKGGEEYQPRDKKEIESLENLVRKSAGFNEGRGDQVAVTNMPFKKSDGEAETTGEGSWYEKVLLFSPLIKYGAVMAGIALIFLFVLRPLVKGITMEETGRGMQARQLPLPMAVEAGATGEPPPSISLDELTEKTMTEADITRRLASADAKKFAELLRNWLK